MIGRSRDADRLENYIYEFISVGVLIRQYENDRGLLERYIDQMCFYDRLDGKNSIYMLVEDGKLVSKNIPKDILKRMVRAGISNPFQCVETCPYEPLDVELVKAVRRHNRNGEEMMDAGAKPKVAGAFHAAGAKPVGGA